MLSAFLPNKFYSAAWLQPKIRMSEIDLDKPDDESSDATTCRSVCHTLNNELSDFFLVYCWIKMAIGR